MLLVVLLMLFKFAVKQRYQFYGYSLDFVANSVKVIYMYTLICTSIFIGGWSKKKKNVKYCY